MHSSSLSDLKKTTEVVESSSQTSTRCSFPENFNQLKDEDCTKLAQSNKVAVKTYTTEKIKIVGSYKLFVLYPDTKCLQEVTFQVTSHEGSVIISCATSIDLNLI